MTQAERLADAIETERRNTDEYLRLMAVYVPSSMFVIVFSLLIIFILSLFPTTFRLRFAPSTVTRSPT